jgi:hypothetical protein
MIGKKAIHEITRTDTKGNQDSANEREQDLTMTNEK